jgi:hypothetical protein
MKVHNPVLTQLLHRRCLVRGQLKAVFQDAGSCSLQPPYPLTFQHSAFSHQLSHRSVIGECAGQCSLYIPRSRLNGLNQLSARKLGRLFCSLGKVSCLWQNEAVWYPFCHECLRNRHRTTLETIGEVLAYRIFVVCNRLVNKLEYHTFKRAANSVVMS